MNFQDFAGNSRGKAELSTALDSGNIPHALLFEGAKGTGKRTLAKLTAMGILCQSTGEKPCFSCLSCRKVIAGAHPDIVLESGGESARSFHIDQVRAIRSDAFILPNESERKVYILADAHNMSEQAQNSLLKILEEPPTHVYFILTCISRSDLLLTVVSRCQVISLDAVAPEEAVIYLAKEFPEVERETLYNASVLWGGRIGQILEGLQSGSLGEAAELTKKLADSLTSGELSTLTLTARFEKDKSLFRACLPLLEMILRDAMAFHAGVRLFLSGCPEEAKKLSGRFSQTKILQMMQIIKEMERGLERNANYSILLTRFCSGIRRAAE